VCDVGTAGLGVIGNPAGAAAVWWCETGSERQGDTAATSRRLPVALGVSIT
jgi:hypothetical protein